MNKKADIIVREANEDEILGIVDIRNSELEIPFIADPKTVHGIDIQLQLPQELEHWGQTRKLKMKIRNVCGKINVPHKEPIQLKW